MALPFEEEPTAVAELPQSAHCSLHVMTWELYRNPSQSWAWELEAGTHTSNVRSPGAVIYGSLEGLDYGWQRQGYRKMTCPSS